MHAQPPRTLKRLLKQYGQELIDDPRRTEALLRDHCGQHSREIFVLVNAQKQRIPSELMAAPAWMPRQATYSRLSRLLQTKLAITEDAADWAVASWAAALDLEAMPKGDGWSWLPGQSRAPTQPSNRKQRSKKRQNSPSSVQSSKKSVRHARARAARAELGWGFPFLHASRLLDSFVAKNSWAHLLPWAALIVATIFLLAVIYWTSTARSVPVAPGEASAGEANATAVSAGAAGESGPATPPQASATPLPQLPESPSAYLGKVMALPTWANVNVNDSPLLIREQPSTESPFLSVLQDGDPVQVVAFSDDGQWSQINSPRAGWVSNHFLLFISEDATHSSIRLGVQILRARHDAQIHNAPLSGAGQVATLAANELVIVVGELGEPPAWYQIADPATGWVAANDLISVAP